MHFFCIFFSKNLQISKIYCTFAPEIEGDIITIIFNNNINNLKFTIMKTRNGQVAWLSANTGRVFLDFEKAVNDSQNYNYIKYKDDNRDRAYDDVYIVSLWLNEE